MHKQRGYVNLDGIEYVFYLSLVGLVALLGGAVWLIWWLIKHITFV